MKEIKINKDIYTGPKIFLKRLHQTNKIPKNINICNPDNFSIKQARNKKDSDQVLIARLDGTYFYKFTIKEIIGFLGSRGYLKYKKDNLGESIEPSRRLTKAINRALNNNIKWLISNSEGVIFQSQFSKNLVDKFLDTSNLQKFSIINNGVNLDEYNPSLNDHRWKEYYPNLLISASSYRPQKRLNDAIKLVNSLSKIYPKIHLHVLGNVNKAVKEELVSLDLSRSTFHGKISLEDLPSFYSSCDLQLHLALFDPCPNVVVEGLASGLPVVTPRLSGAYELIQYQKDWSIEENSEIDYYENHRPWAFPSIDLLSYEQKLIPLIENIDQNKEIARDIAERNLNIDYISSKYIYFINQVTGNLDEETT